MLNARIGSVSLFPDGQQKISTRQGEVGHAIYGPYERVDPGQYIVEFDIVRNGDLSGQGDAVLGNVDVVAEHGARVFARTEFSFSQLQDGAPPLRLSFSVDRPGTLQYRVFTNGVLPLVVGDFPVKAAVPPGVEPQTALALRRFPSVVGGEVPPFFLRRLREFRQMHNNGADVRVDGERTVVTINGVAFHADTADDINFVGEIFQRNTYNFLQRHDACVIDIGMNLGLVSLAFASKSFVKEVHSFEPFRETFERAEANLKLNPKLADKITAYNFGLAGSDQEISLLISDEGDSGSNSIRGASKGKPTAIQVRKASTVLEPIFRSAKAKGRDIVAKIDCEGSEFEIFEVLQAAGLWRDVTAVMVEWHRVVDGKTQKDLIDVLIDEGFSAINLSAPLGNGFFYAMKTHAKI
jgi:FkbM family methyltransferase